MAWKFTADPDRFEEAIGWLLQRTVVSQAEAMRMREDSRHRAFWIGAGAELSTIQTVFDEINTAVSTGESFADFKKRTRDLLDEAHLETVFRNAAQRSYNAGRHRQLKEPQTLRLRPYWMFDAVLDQRTTETICKPLDGTTLEADAEFWRTRIPPLHHRCRSGIRSLRAAEAKRRGITETAPDVAPGKGFGHEPDSAPVWKPKPPPAHDAELHKELERKAKVEDVPPEHPIKARAKELEQALADGDGKQVRAILREQIAFTLPGSVPRAAKLEGADRFVVNDALLSAYHAEGALFPGTGHIEVTSSVRNRAKRALADLAQSKRADDRTLDGLRVLIHEELHGHSRLSPSSYDGAGRVIEEVGTELNARRILARILGEPVNYGAYVDEVEAVVNSVRKATGQGRGAVLELIADAHWRAALLPGEEFTTPDGALRAWLDALDVEPAQRQAIESELS